MVWALHSHPPRRQNIIKFCLPLFEGSFFGHSWRVLGPELFVLKWMIKMGGFGIERCGYFTLLSVYYSWIDVSFSRKRCLVTWRSENICHHLCKPMSSIFKYMWWSLEHSLLHYTCEGAEFGLAEKIHDRIRIFNLGYKIYFLLL